MRNYLKVGLYGDSLSMARPDVVANQERYFYKLLENIKNSNPGSVIETIQRSKASISAPELYSLLYHDSVYYSWTGEICIFHLGIVDCAPRPVDMIMRERIGKLPEFIKQRIIKYLHNNRRNILLKGKAKFVTPENIFQLSVKQLLDLASKKYNKVYVINICPTNDETEFKSPGLKASIAKYNKIINDEIISEGKDNIFLVDIYNYILKREVDIDKYILKADGHHITPLTHEVIYELMQPL